VEKMKISIEFDVDEYTIQHLAGYFEGKYTKEQIARAVAYNILSRYAFLEYVDKDEIEEEIENELAGIP
jgi:hypothetical protein